jgi:hypothetical protein
MRFKPRSVMLLSMFVMLVVGVSASAASAATEPAKFEWKVNGAPLASGSSKTLTAKDKSPGLFHLGVNFSGSEVEFTSSQIKFTSGGEIRGGTPGTGLGALVLEGVKVIKPVNCSVKEGKITTYTLESEIVENTSAEHEITGKTELLFTPSGVNPEKIWTVFELEGTCGIQGSLIKLQGNLLAAISPQKAEAKVGQLVFEGSRSKQYRNSKNEYKKAGLTFAGSAATLTGEAETELVSKEVFGAF